jgi:hypothetical protein
VRSCASVMEVIADFGVACKRIYKKCGKMRSAQCSVGTQQICENLKTLKLNHITEQSRITHLRFLSGAF